MSCQAFLQEQHVKSLQGHSCVSCHISKHVGSISPLTGKLSKGAYDVAGGSPNWGDVIVGGGVKQGRLETWVRYDHSSYLS